MSGRDLLRRSAVAVLLLGVAGLVVTGLRLADFGAPSDPGGTPVAGSVQVPRPAAQVAAAKTVRGATLLPAPSTEEQLAVRELLVTRAHAVLTGDRKEWSVTTPYDQSRQTRRQLALFDRLVALRPVSWAYTDPQISVPPAESGPPGERSLAVTFHLKYALIEGGPTVTRDQAVTVTGKAGRWWVSDLAAEASSTSGTYAATGESTGESTGNSTSASASAAAPAVAGRPAVDLWDLSPVVRVVGDRCVVIGAPKRQAWVRWFANHCGEAQTTVDAAVPGAADRPVRTLLVVPADLGQLARLLGRTDTAGLARTAAVTIGPAKAPAEEVLMNADAFGQLRGVGRRVVLTHELVHVATRASQTADVPTWLDEGLADEIAYRGKGLGPSTIAGPVIQAARAGRFPQALPTAADFDAAADDAAGGGPAVAYARAWSAADTIADRAGLAELVQLHHLVGTGTSLDAAFEQVLGMDQPEFLRVWAQHLRELSKE